MQGLIHRDLSPEQRELCLGKLADCNRVLHRWHALSDGVGFLDMRKMAFGGILAMDPAELESVRSVCQPLTFLDGRSVEQAVIEAHARLAIKLGNEASRKQRLLTPEDCIQEAFLKLFEGIYRWIPERGCSLPSFLCLVIQKRLRSVSGQGSLLSALKNSDKKLLELFRAAKSASPGLCDTAVIDSMGLKPKHKLNLCKALASGLVVQAANVEEAPCRHASDLGLQQEDVDEIISRSGLTEIEERLVRAAMDPHKGWQTEFAEMTVSKTTGRPLSKMRVTQMLQAARRKVAAVLEAGTRDYF